MQKLVLRKNLVINFNVGRFAGNFAETLGLLRLLHKVNHRPPRKYFSWSGCVDFDRKPSEFHDTGLFPPQKGISSKGSLDLGRRSILNLILKGIPRGGMLIL